MVNAKKVYNPCTHQLLLLLSSCCALCLQSAGVQVKLFQHTLEHGTPDAVFPNNWFSTHPASETGQESALVLYPMKTKNRYEQPQVGIPLV